MGYPLSKYLTHLYDPPHERRGGGGSVHVIGGHAFLFSCRSIAIWAELKGLFALRDIAFFAKSYFNHALFALILNTDSSCPPVHFPLIKSTTLHTDKPCVEGGLRKILCHLLLKMLDLF